jgi:hypothetical protein
MSKWFLFWDMHSGGSEKVKGGALIFVRAESEDSAVEIFEKTFNRDPYHVTCNCCGADYSISEAESLAQITGYHRNCAWANGRYVERPEKYSNKVVPLDEFLNNGKCIVVGDYDIRAELLELS